MVLTVNDPRPGEGTKRVTAAHGWKRFQYSLRVLLSWARLELLALFVVRLVLGCMQEPR